MIVCPHCFWRRQGLKANHTGKSRVVESRKILSKVLHRGKRIRVRSIVRTRQCVKCRYRWKTIEMPIHRRM